MNIRKGMFGVLWVAALGVVLLSCGHIHTQKLYQKGIVVCADSIAAETGLQILKDGGNAVDAACATALTMAVTLPRAGNIGGGGFALIYLADSGKVYFLDFRETAPAMSEAKRYLSDNGRVNREKATVGPLSSGVPGTVAGLFSMQSRYGRAVWSDIVHPARLLADTGFAVYNYLAESINDYSDYLSRYPSTESIFLPGGQPLRTGEKFKQKDLARTLRRIEESGRDGFYLGETAERIEKFCRANGGLITQADLRQYQAIWREPIHVRFRELDVFGPNLPSSGGVVMGQILSMLDTFELEKFTSQSPEYLHLFTETARRAFADREQYLGDPSFTPDFSKELLNEKYIQTRLQSIDINRASSSENIHPGVPMHRESDETTHLVAADADGNIVSLTYTLNLSYGSKAVVDSCGFLLNNEMDDFAIAPGQPNAFGLIGGEANKIEPGKRMLSSMTPTIILRKGRPYMALGSPGGSKIITSVAQTILNYRIFEMSLTEAVQAPRIHHQWLPDTLYMEKGFGESIRSRLATMGHKIKERSRFGGVMAIAFSQDGLFFSGAADNRRPGATVRGY